MTGLDAQSYWDSHYSDTFIFGLGTERILELLQKVPAVESWLDVGSGAESLLWACALSAKRLIAVDLDGERLTRLRDYAESDRPRGAYRTVLQLTGRTIADWPLVRSRLQDTRVADCLSGHPPVSERAELVTQFGLLGLCQDEPSFYKCFSALAELAVPGGWLVGANWMAADATDRVVLTAAIYRRALANCPAQLVHLEQIASADPAYPWIWVYLARKPETATGIAKHP